MASFTELLSNRSDDATVSRSEQVYRALRRAIRDGSLNPGDRIREVEVARNLDVSRTPVREALGRLTAEGLTSYDETQALVVTELTDDAVHELYVMREALEGSAASLAATNATSVQVAMLREIADKDFVIQDDPGRLAENNRLFHDALYRSARNRYLLASLSSLQASIELLGPTSLSIDGRQMSSVEEHQALTSAIERRDAKAAEDLARAHIRSALKARMKSRSGSK
jgi:DNA-binding GntR family transcriptional regulator